MALRVCAPAVAYLHVHDNDGRNDSHLMPGRGGETGIDWTAFREALDATGCAAVRMLEVFEDPALSGPGLKDRLAGWMGA